MSVPPALGAQRGVVLLSVLLILALLSALAYQLVGRQSLVVAQARQTFSGDQSLEYALGGEAFARQLLFEDWSQTGQGTDNLTEAWAQPLAPFEVEEGFLEIQIRDLNGCFNLNSVVAGQGGARANLDRLKTLLRNLNVPETLAEAWMDWIDPDQDIQGFGAEDGEYLLGETSYRTADRPAAHVSELALLRDVDAEQLAALTGAVCVIPSDELRLNVNTASAAALASLNPALSEAQLVPFVESERAFRSVEEVTAQQAELAPAVDALGVTSEYFEVQIRAQVGDSLTELATLLHRNPDDGVIRLVMRDLGKSFRSQFVDTEATTPSQP